jgi:hypothetical protein
MLIPINLGSRIFPLRSPWQNFRYSVLLTIIVDFVIVVQSEIHGPRNIETGSQINGVPIYNREIPPTNIEVGRLGKKRRFAGDGRPLLDRGYELRMTASVRIPEYSTKASVSYGEIFSPGEVAHGDHWFHARDGGMERNRVPRQLIYVHATYMVLPGWNEVLLAVQFTPSAPLFFSRIFYKT